MDQEKAKKTEERFTCGLGSSKDQVRFSFSCHFIHIYSVLPSWEKFTDVHGCSCMRKIWKRILKLACIANIGAFNFYKSTADIRGLLVSAD